MPKIHLTTTDGTSLEFEITERVSFGRAEGNDAVIPDGSVSSNHGEFAPHGDGVEITDKGSTNGTFINGERTQGGVANPGDAFKLGSVEGYVVGVSSEVEEEEGAAEGYEASGGEESWSAPSSGGGAAMSGLGASACPTNLRKGFGPKAAKKDGKATLAMALGVLSLIVCGIAAFLISQMGES
jgi:pSer/pThr/pTyr-binding forkhead associated (FHA) protein